MAVLENITQSLALMLLMPVAAVAELSMVQPVTVAPVGEVLVLILEHTHLVQQVPPAV